MTDRDEISKAAFEAFCLDQFGAKIEWIEGFPKGTTRGGLLIAIEVYTAWLGWQAALAHAEHDRGARDA
jgi:hypothetical protein